ncbi:MAG TPA: transketolase [Actinomycetota bacterium]
MPGTATQTADMESLRRLSQELRVKIIEMLVEAGSGHPGGSLSEIDMLVCLYFGGILRYRADEPAWPDRDRFVLSKGHCTPGYYSVLARAGFFSEELLPTFRKLESPLQGHPDRTRLAGVELSAGSLGQGLSAAVGMAFAARLDDAEWQTYCMCGDGESQSGHIWEAIMCAGNYKLDNLTAIVDYNQVQQTGMVAEIQDLEPFADKFRAFKWNVLEIDGHDHRACLDALTSARDHRGAPTAIISNTKKGKGVSWMELDYNWHGKAPSAEEAGRAIAEIMGGRA